MLKRLIIALLLLAVYACSDPPLVVWEQHSLTESELDDCANEPCPDITINYTLAKGEGTVSESINTQIEARMMAVFTNAEDAPNSLEDAIQSFTKRYQELLTDFPESAGADNYEAQVEVTNHGQIGNIASLEHWAYLYEGGAHGWSGSDFLNFDLRTGTQLSMDDLFTSKMAWTMPHPEPFIIAPVLEPGCLLFQPWGERSLNEELKNVALKVG